MVLFWKACWCGCTEVSWERGLCVEGRGWELRPGYISLPSPPSCERWVGFTTTSARDHTAFPGWREGGMKVEWRGEERLPLTASFLRRSVPLIRLQWNLSEGVMRRHLTRSHSYARRHISCFCNAAEDLRREKGYMQIDTSPVIWSMHSCHYPPWMSFSYMVLTLSAGCIESDPCL